MTAVPQRLLAKLRRICLAFPDAYEEEAWVGTRWMIRKRNFAHVLRIERGWPPAYASAADSDGPLNVLTFRTSASLRDVLRDAAPRFFHAPWGTRWGTKVMGLKLDASVDWGEVELLLGESYRLLAPHKRRRG
ncbi:MAG TPA: MmcQ/YjbR family DNA-binding protein [Polyangiales bacterium]|nr:MmcQ/YjbR family DNA-binding protein [Polyangiales bacterium]